VFEKNKLRPGYIYATMHPKAGAVDCVRCSSKNKKAQTQQRQWGWRRHGWDAGAASERTRREIREMLRRNCLPALQRYSARATGRGPFRALAAHLAPYPRVRLLLRAVRGGPPRSLAGTRARRVVCRVGEERPPSVPEERRVAGSARITDGDGIGNSKVRLIVL
jgi:hypothetical protein